MVQKYLLIYSQNFWENVIVYISKQFTSTNVQRICVDIPDRFDRINAWKFKRGILNEGLTSFLELGDNNLTNGLPLPFPILTEVFKGIRKGETMAFAMPSNAGKSRFTTDVAAHTAFVHNKKVLIISNEK